MIWLLVAIATTALTFRSLVTSGFPGLEGESRGFLGWVAVFVVGAFLSAFIALAPLGAAAFIGSLPKVHGVPDATYPLVALRQQDGFEGRSYFLGSGMIESREYYFWYRQNADGSVSGGKTYREPGVTIFTSETPRMTTYRTEYVDPNVSKWMPWFGLDMRSATKWCDTFEIPSGSIKQGFSL